MIRCQCMKVLLDKNKHEPDWETTIESYNPLTLLKLIEKKYWLRLKTKIAMQYCTIKSVHCMDAINTTWQMNGVMSDLILMSMLEKLLI